MMMKTKNWRRRVEDDDADGDEVEKPAVKGEKTGKSGAHNNSNKKKEKASLLKMQEKASGSKLLSFAVEDEEAAEGIGKQQQRSKSVGARVSVAKSGGQGGAAGVGPRAGLTKEVTVATLSNVQPQAGEYTKEKLLELQRNTKSLGAPPKAPVESKPLEPVLVLKGLVKPSISKNGSASEEGRNGNAMSASVVVAEEEHVQERGFSDVKAKDDAESRLGLMGIGTGADSGGITHIPDAAVIAAAKARRNRLRQAQAAPDYIPVDGAEGRGKNRESGLVREQDDEIGKARDREEVESSEDEAEFQTRVAFLGDSVSGRQKQKGGVFQSVNETNANLGSQSEHRDEEEEDEDRRWEEEQLRKGFGKRVEDAAHRGRLVVPEAPSVQGDFKTGFVGGALPSVPAGSAGWGFGRSSMEALSVAQQAAAAMRILQENAHRLREGHETTKNNLFRTNESLSSSLTAVASLERSLAGANEKYLYMQELRDYVSVLCEFLQDKGPIIEELEEAMQRLHEERANALLERRAADNADELIEIEAAVSAAKAVLARGAGTATATAAAAAAIAAVQDGTSSAPKLDEFGRDVNLQKRLESKRRAQARERRLKRAAERRMAPNTDVASAGRIEGESSSEESESEERAYKSGRQEILQTAERVFGDASEDYSQLRNVKQRLETWKRDYGAAYHDAYMSLSAPAIFAPYVRLELLHWDPLYGSAGLDTMQWYALLFDYGMQVNGKKVEEDDADVNLIPKLVEKVALPVLHHEVAHCWDALSTEGSKHAVAAFQEMLIYVDVSSEPLQELLAAARTRMAEAVAALELPSWSLQVTAAVPRAGRFAAQQFGTSVRLLRNIGLWKDILALPVLEHLALDQLLSAKILVHLRTLLPTVHDAVVRTERVLTSLSGVWVGGSSAELSPKLAPFIEYLLSLTRAIEKRREGGASSDDTTALARRVKRLLVEVNEYDRARRLSKLFQLKEAL
ncbi:unnamed protein product [Sphagnum jensenii]|uniref:GCF C-terminal domain-containing protein n=1 Tax=Sphagnum jensenii TaxID=128206 RepID=A0ABP0XE36_9BRYO